jgi:predicted transcriptional regulator
MVDSSLKQKVLDAVDQLPPTTTIEDLMERLYFLAKIERGVADAEAGRVLPHQDVRTRFAI